MKKYILLLMTCASIAGLLSNASAQDRSFRARSFIMDDNAGHNYTLQVPSLGGNLVFTFPSTAITPGSLLFGSDSNKLSVLGAGNPGDFLIFGEGSMPIWSSNAGSMTMHLASLQLGTNGTGGTPGLLTILDGQDPGATGSFGFSSGSFTTGGAGLNAGTGAITGGAISGTSLTLSSTISGATGITSSGPITFSGLTPAGVVHNSVTGLLSTGPVTNGDLSNSSITLSNGTGVTVTGGGPVSLGGTATIAIGQDVATTATPQFAGMSLTGDLAMGTKLITGLGTPVAGTDAATKAYVDAAATSSIDAAVALAPATSTRNVVLPTADATALTLKGFTTQTSPLLDIQNNAGTSLASISGTGAITAASLNAGSGTIQTTGTMQTGTMTVTGTMTGAGVGKFAGRVPAASVTSVAITVPAVTPTSAVIITLESSIGSVPIPFVSNRNTLTGIITVSFSGVTPADCTMNYLVIN